jgi:sulfite exporter TauE/SafE
MCGPLILAYSLHLKGYDATSARRVWVFQNSVFNHTAFHLGRLLTYGFLGAMGGVLGYVTEMNRLFFNLRSGVTIVSGTLMVLAGLVLLRVLPLPLLVSAPFGADSLFGRWLPRLFQSQGMGSKMALGLVSGFLPCMLSWSMIVKAASTQSLAIGFLTMFAFGLGTVPVLFFTGFSTSVFSLKARFMGERVAALSIVAMGLILVLKGVRIFA